MSRASINPFYAGRGASNYKPAEVPAGITRRVIGNATLYRADCFDILPTLSGIGAVVTDPPYGIGFEYRSYDDAPGKYEAMMARLIPELIRITDDGPCFVWQSPLTIEHWHRYFPPGFRVIAACKEYQQRARRRCVSWDPVIFWSGRSLLRDELPRDWHVTELRPWKKCPDRNPVPSPKPLEQVRYFCDHQSGPRPSSTRSWAVVQPAWPPCSRASDSSASSATRFTLSMHASGLPRQWPIVPRGSLPN